jgi:hypothetical protein
MHFAVLYNFSFHLQEASVPAPAKPLSKDQKRSKGHEKFAPMPVRTNQLVAGLTKPVKFAEMRRNRFEPNSKIGRYG